MGMLRIHCTIELKRYANRLDTKCERGVPNDSLRFLAKQLETSDQERRKKGNASLQAKDQECGLRRVMFEVSIRYLRG